MTPPSHRIARWSFSLLALLLVGLIPGFAQQAVPTLTGRVVDQAGILSSATKEAITALLAAHEEATSNQVVVLTIPSLEGEAIETFSLRVAESWALGTAQYDNGVLLTIAVEDRELRIEVGLGLEGDLTDAVAGRIIRNDIVPVFRAGDFDAGVLVGVQSILGVLEGTYAPPEGSPSEDEIPILMRVLFALMFIAMPLFAFVPSFFLAGQWGNLGFMGLFIVVGGFVCFFSLIGTVLTAAAYIGLLVLAEIVFRSQDNWRETRREVNEALKENKGRRVTVNVGGLTFRAGGITSSSSSGGSGGGWSGGGGFSGGGGSFGGGGASGSW